MGLRRRVLVLMLVALPACADDPVPVDDGPDAGAAPVAAALDRCLGEGGSLSQAAGVDNLHGAITALALSPGGQVALASEDGSIKLWTLHEQEAPRSATYDSAFGEHEPIARALAYAPAGDWIAAGVDNGAVDRWDVAGTARIDSRSSGGAAVEDVAVDAAGRLIASADGSSGGNLKVWPIEGPGAADPLETVLWFVHAVAFHPSSGALIDAGDIYGEPALELRDPADPGRVVALWDGTGAFAGDSTLRALAVSADGRRAVAVGPGLVAVFDLDDLAAGPIAATVVDGHEAFAVALTPGERYFVTAGAEGTLRVFDAETAAAVGQLERAGLAGLASDAVSGQLVSGGADGKIRLFGCAP